MPRQTFYQQISESLLPLDVSAFDLAAVFVGSIDEPPDIVDETCLLPFGQLDPLDTPADVAPDPTWFVESVNPPPSSDDATLYDFGFAQIDEGDFELPPESPELAWQGRSDDPDDEPYDIPDHDHLLVNEALYGSIDYHPGYWFVGDHFHPAETPDETHLQPFGELAIPSSLFVDPQPLQSDWLTTLDQPGEPQDDVDSLTQSAVPLFPVQYVRLFADSLRYYLTGADADNGTQADPADSLGGYRSSTEAEHGSYIQLSGIPGLSIDYASRANGDSGQLGSLAATSSNSVSYAASGGQIGPVVKLTPGETYTVHDGADPSKFVRVTRTSSAPLLGIASLEYHDQYGNVVSMDDAPDAESTAGGDRYRAVMLRCESFASVANIRLYLRTLGASTLAAGGGLPTTGAGTISTTVDGLCDWPHQGWARIETAGGTLREIVYYSERTNNQLVIPALGRSRLGTAASLGAADDRVYPVPPLRIAWESSTVDGDVQTVADETAAPTGLTWSTAITPAGGINAGSLVTDQNGGLWLHRELPAGVSAYSEHQSQVAVQFDVEGVTYTETLGGLFRIAVAASRRLELRIGVGSPPDPLSDPDETEVVAIGTTPEDHLDATPWTTSAELTDDAVNYISVNFRNEYGLSSEELITETIALSGGNASEPPPSAPVIQSVDPSTGGKIRIRGAYFYEQDELAARGDTWLIYLTSDGSTPTPGVTSPLTEAFTAIGGVVILDHTTVATFADGVEVKVLLRVRRAADTSDSESSSIMSTMAIASGPGQVSGGLFYRRQSEA